MEKKHLLRHINSGIVKEMTAAHARDFFDSPSWEEIDKTGRAIPKPKKAKPLNPVLEPPVFKKERSTNA